MRINARLRRLFPRVFIKLELVRLHRQRSALRSQKLPKLEQRNRLATLDEDEQQLHEWQTAIDDEVLWRRAAKIGVYPDEIHFEYDDDPTMNDGRYHRIGRFGDRLFIDEFRVPFSKAIRVREPIYRKEWWAQADAIAKIASAFVAFIAAIVGLIIALKK